MKPVAFDDARAAAMARLAEIRGSDSTRQQVLALLDAIKAGYQARALECGEQEVPDLRAGAKQIEKLRRALMEKDIKAIGLFLL